MWRSYFFKSGDFHKKKIFSNHLFCARTSFTNIFIYFLTLLPSRKVVGTYVLIRFLVKPSIFSVSFKFQEDMIVILPKHIKDLRI